MLRFFIAGMLLLGLTPSVAFSVSSAAEPFPCGLNYSSPEYDVAERQHYEDLLFVSPDRKWKVSTEEVYGSDWQEDVYRLRVISSVDGITRTVTFSETLGAKYGLQDGVVRPDFWTNDSRFLYIRIMIQADGPGVFIQKGAKLIRLEPITGKVETLLEEDHNGWPAIYAFAVSPEGKFLASVNLSKETRNILVRNLKTGRVRRITPPIQKGSDGPGELVWSPRSNRIAFVMHEGDEAITGWVLNLTTGRFERLWVGTRSRATTYIPGWRDDRHVIIADNSQTLIRCTIVQVN